MAKASGLKVIGTAGSAAGMQLVQEQGADFVFNHKNPNYMEKIKEIFPDGIEIVLEMLANVNLNNDIQILKWKKGRVVVSRKEAFLFFFISFNMLGKKLMKR